MINMKKQVWRAGALCLAGVVALSVTGVSVYAKTSEKKETEIKEQIQDAVSDIWKSEDTTAASIDETVYVILDAGGTQQKIYVSDWLKNQGDKDSYTQSTPDKEAPVSVKITYLLDGSEIAPADLVGKSGHVTIRYDYTNEVYETREIAGKEEKIYVPFAVMTGMILDNDVFSNIQVSSGKVINDGSHSVVTGIVFPGLGSNLYMEDDFDDYLEIEADAKSFTINESYCIATNSIFSRLDLSDMDDLDDLKDAMNDLDDATSQLMDGSSDLYDGVSELYDKSGDLIDGVKELSDGSVDLRDGAYKVADGTVTLRDGIGALKSGSESLQSGTKSLQTGAAQLSTGLTTLNSNSATLVAGAGQVFDTLLASASQQLSAATGMPISLTKDNYHATLEAILAQLSAAAGSGSTGSGSTASALTSQTVTAPAASDSTAAEDTNADEADADISEEDSTTSEDTTSEDVAASEAENAAAEDSTLPESTVAEAVSEVTEISNEEISAVEEDSSIDASTSDEKAEEIIADDADSVTDTEDTTEDTAPAAQAAKTTAAPQAAAGNTNQPVKYASAVETIKALEQSLDSYNTFYQGLIAYTNGVASANDGAAKLAAGTTQVADGAAKLVSGSDDLFTGATTLMDGSKDLASGAGTLANGVTTLSDGSDALVDGIRQLRDGAKELKDGIVKFNDEGISKLTELDTDELQEIIARMKATASVSENYNSFIGSNDGMDSSVKFIYKISAVK